MKRSSATPLFDILEHLPATDPNVAIHARRRLSGQNRRILDLLSEGPARLRDIAAIAAKYTSRISDLRKAGCVIKCEEQSDGNSIYELISKPSGL
ncbi:MAG: hypothetical protein P4L67_04690 [Candidatus Pacebacteria bacterium]|nr:hypothetical protein [Candidatus Paceibacterota bacterium]